MALFEDQLASRQIDVAARELKKTDPQLLHDQLGRARGQRDHRRAAAHGRPGVPALPLGRLRHGARPPARRAARRCSTRCSGVVASSEDPIAQGRHKVWGSRPLWIPPQTSTIASHLPKAMGLAFSLARAKRIGVGIDLPEDAVVVCSFGDASANHATALAAINTARYAVRMGLPMPLLLVCEDNGTGISVPTPDGWIASTFGGMPHLRYVLADGEIDEVWSAVETAIAHVRGRAPARLPPPADGPPVGHAGSDAEQTYRSLAEIEAVEARDPLAAQRAATVEIGAATPDELRDLVRETRAAGHGRRPKRRRAGRGCRRPRRSSRRWLPTTRSGVRERAAAPSPTPDERAASFGATLPETAAHPTARTLAGAMNAALADELLRRPELLVFGEDVGRKGGVYNVTNGLQKRFGRPASSTPSSTRRASSASPRERRTSASSRSRRSSTSPTSITRIDQLRGEAATLQFFSSGQFRNPMVVRVAGLGLPEGLRRALPQRQQRRRPARHPRPGAGRRRRAATMRRDAPRCDRHGDEDGRVVVFLEPIALYHEKDLHADGDGGWLTDYPAPPGRRCCPARSASTARPMADADLLLISYANGLRLSLQAAKRLAEQHDLRARVLDLRWLNPLPTEAIRAHAADAAPSSSSTNAARLAAGVADAIIADLAEQRIGERLGSVRAVDSFVPLGPATSAVLVGVDQIVASSVAAAGRSRETAGAS